MALPLQHTGTAAPPSLVSELLTILTAPARAWPLLVERGRSAEVLTFSAVSGVYVAFSGAQRLNLGDHIGFAWSAIGVVMVGASLGMIALAVAGGLLAWSAERLHGHARTERMHAVFGYATWPFVPLLVVLVPLHLLAYGGGIFSASRLLDPGPLPAVTMAVELATIVLWLYMMITGTSTVAKLTRARAAEALALSLLEAVVIGILFLVIMVISFMI